MSVELRYSGTGTDPNASLGGFMSSIEIPINARQASLIENLFDNLSDIEVAAQRTEYRMFYVYNGTSSDYLNVMIRNIRAPHETVIGFCPDYLNYIGTMDDAIAYKSRHGNIAFVPQLIEEENRNPVGIDFYNNLDYSTLEIPLGPLYSRKAIPIWIKRTPPTTASGIRTITFDLFGELVNLDSMRRNVATITPSAVRWTSMDAVSSYHNIKVKVTPSSSSDLAKINEAKINVNHIAPAI